ncbi:unnamed protein product [Pleuronectes platessa]|uniref:Uncharacterized protein n=1 Tax=Pleuronectes platessa TaxID=8262 RepID=A0A9N7UCW1_PLEPL|nr:unnamed protein product [Pleuronectes platessa]
MPCRQADCLRGYRKWGEGGKGRGTGKGGGGFGVNRPTPVTLPQGFCFSSSFDLPQSPSPRPPPQSPSHYLPPPPMPCPSPLPPFYRVFLYNEQDCKLQPVCERRNILDFARHCLFSPPPDDLTSLLLLLLPPLPGRRKKGEVKPGRGVVGLEGGESAGRFFLAHPSPCIPFDPRQLAHDPTTASASRVLPPTLSVSYLPGGVLPPGQNMLNKPSGQIQPPLVLRFSRPTPGNREPATFPGGLIRPEAGTGRLSPLRCQSERRAPGIGIPFPPLARPVGYCILGCQYESTVPQCFSWRDAGILAPGQLPGTRTSRFFPPFPKDGSHQVFLARISTNLLSPFSYFAPRPGSDDGQPCGDARLSSRLVAL